MPIPAPGYGDGASERLFGQVLRGRDDVFVATKVAALDGKRVLRSVEQSLQRLGRIDLVQFHGTSYTDAMQRQVLGPEGGLEALELLRGRGLIRFIGFTSEDQNAPVYAFIASGRFDVMQICYNFIYQHPAEPTRPFGAIVEADRAGMGVVTMRTATSGTFQRWVQKVNPANTFDYTPALIQFVLSNALVDTALVGMRTATEVRRNVELLNDTSGRMDIAELHDRFWHERQEDER
jgi:uncharacterized protein